jgi:GNAT superfamily N-acetyltransferase
MNSILKEFSPPKLIIANEENMSSFLPVFGHLGEFFLDNPVGVKRSITDIPIPSFNSVMDARLSTEQIEPAIRGVLDDAKVRKVPVLWWTGPSTRPQDLGKCLENNGFTLDEDGPGMAVELEKLNETLPVPDGFSIQLALSDADWRIWSRTMAAGFEVPASAGYVEKAWHNLLCYADPKTLLTYTGYLEDRPIATSLLFLAAGVAGIYAVATIPEARRKGIGALMTQYPLIQARSKGYKVGILQSSEMSLRVYRSLGFQEYCRIVSYRWQPEMVNAG